MGELENNYWIKKFNLLIDRNESNYSSGAARSRNSTLLNGEEATSLHKKSFNSSNEIRKCRNVYRDPFILDRDRILYSRAFKRLSRKTQLFAPEKRIVENRLTHTLKVAQLARSICHGLCLNENLAESISYGHDVGHPPFGHTGERSIQRWVDEKIKLINVEYEQMHLSGDLPEGLLSKITKDKQPSVQSHFIFGTDKEEKLFMHGRQSFKLLALFDKDRRNEYFQELKNGRKEYF